MDKSEMVYLIHCVSDKLSFFLLEWTYIAYRLLYLLCTAEPNALLFQGFYICILDWLAYSFPPAVLWPFKATSNMNPLLSNNFWDTVWLLKSCSHACYVIFLIYTGCLWFYFVLLWLHWLIWRLRWFYLRSSSISHKIISSSYNVVTAYCSLCLLS